MYLKQSPQKNGRIYLAIAHGYRDGEGKSKAKTIKSLGYLDELKKHYDDPIAHFKKLCKEESAKIKEEFASQTLPIHPAEKIDMKTENRKNIGCAIPLSYYNGLGIESCLRSYARKKRFSYDPNAIMRLLVVERLVNPNSKLAAYQNKDKYFFKTNFSEDDLYRSLDYFAEIKDKIIAAMNRNIEKSGIREMSHVFYDVTNYYCEIDEADVDKLDEKTGKVIEGIRKKGAEKNKRPDPIVQMGLLQDANAIPITYSIFPGNTNDSVTLLPVLKDLKRNYNLSRVIVVADKGLNTSTNIAANILDGNGYVFSQSIRGSKSSNEVRDWVLAEDDYVLNSEGSFKIKSRIQQKTIHIDTIDENGKEKTEHIDVDVKIVAYWSEKYARRTRHKREEAICKAKKLIANPSLYTKATTGGCTKYIKNISFDKKTGEIVIDAGKHAILDEKLISEQEKCDGYYCIITSETHLKDEEIIDIYKGLWRIEEAFKISKSDMGFRPMYVRKPEHIQAHFLTCYIALTIARLIQFDTKFAYSVAEIREEIAELCGSHEEGNWWLFNRRNKLSEELCQIVGISLSRKRLQLNEIKSILAHVKKKS